MVGDLGEGFRGREADAARDADPAEDLGAKAAAIGKVVVGGGRWRMDERLVDGILLHVHGLIAAAPDTARLATETLRSTSRSLRALVSLAAHPLATLFARLLATLVGRPDACGAGASPSEAELLRCIPTDPDTCAFADMVVQKLIAVYFTILASVGR